MKRLAFALFAVFLTFSAFAADLPPGKWWRRQEIVQMLQLTDEQQSRLDQIFRAAANDLIDLRATAEKASIALRTELDQPQLNRQNIRAIGGRLSEARGKLFERELTMLVDMRSVLTDAQWKTMRQALDQLGNQPMRPNAKRP
jgi:Spy/CpxP family protein refolding chaperone